VKNNDLVKLAPFTSLLWFIGIIVYSRFFADGMQQGWYMSFGNGMLNAVIILLMYKMILDFRRCERKVNVLMEENDR